MSNIKALEKLRELATGSHSYISNGRVLEFVNEIEDEIGERYILAPVDVDGVPIRVGDTVCEVDDRVPMEVMSLTFYEDCVDVNTCGMNPNLLRHVKPRTIEDAISDALRDYAITDMSRDEVIAKYADEIRGMMA